MPEARLCILIDDALIERMVARLENSSDPTSPSAVRSALLAALGAGEASGGHLVVHLKHEGDDIRHA